MLVTSLIRKLLLNFVSSRCVIHAESVTLRLPMRPTLLATSFISPVTSASFAPSFILNDLQRWCSPRASSKIERVLCFAAFLSPLPTLYKNYRGRRLKIVGEPASSKWHRLDNCSYSVILNCARPDNAPVHDKVAYKDVSDRCLEVMEAVDNERVVSGDSSFKNIHGDCGSCTSSNPIVKHYVALSETAVTLRFRVLYVFVLMEIGSRKLWHVNVTPHPTSSWTVQQLREAIPSDHSYHWLIHDPREVLAHRKGFMPVSSYKLGTSRRGEIVPVVP
jgi:hypothetical protein